MNNLAPSEGEGDAYRTGTESHPIVSSAHPSGKHPSFSVASHSKEAIDDPDKDHPKRCRTRGAFSGQPEGLNLRFACPFQKLDPVNNRLCSVPSHRNPTGGFRSMHRLKEHLNRVHGPSKPKKVQVSLMSEDTRDALGKHSSRGQTEEAKWHSLCRLLFPELRDEALPGPYVGGSVSPSFLPSNCSSNSVQPRDCESDILSTQYGETALEPATLAGLADCSENSNQSNCVGTPQFRAGTEAVLRSDAPPSGSDLDSYAWLQQFSQSNSVCFTANGRSSNFALGSFCVPAGADYSTIPNPDAEPTEVCPNLVPARFGGAPSNQSPPVENDEDRALEELARVSQAKDRANEKYTALFEEHHNLRKEVILWLHKHEQLVSLLRVDSRTQQVLLKQATGLSEILATTHA